MTGPSAWADRSAETGLRITVKHGRAFARAARVTFKKDRGGIYVRRDTDGTEVLVYFNDDAKVIACTEIEADEE